MECPSTEAVISAACEEFLLLLGETAVLQGSVSRWTESGNVHVGRLELRGSATQTEQLSSMQTFLFWSVARFGRRMPLCLFDDQRDSAWLSEHFGMVGV